MTTRHQSHLDWPPKRKRTYEAFPCLGCCGAVFIDDDTWGSCPEAEGSWTILRESPVVVICCCCQAQLSTFQRALLVRFHLSPINDPSATGATAALGN